MKIIKKADAVHLDKAEGTQVDYYIRPEYEIHYNDILPGTVQHWHHHREICETIFVADGSIEAHWLDEQGQKQKAVASKGDVIEVENTPHTFVNSSGKNVIFVVFRFIPTGKDQRDVIKNDKVLDEHLD